ncbi:MAG TPA: MFS transporter, partial [Croceibacterium sp.]
LGIGFGPALAEGALTTVFVTLALALFALGLVYGPLGGWMPTLFPVTVRYTGISVAFNGGGVIGGALAPIAATALSSAGGASLVGLFLSAAGVVTLIGIVCGRPTSATG